MTFRRILGDAGAGLKWACITLVLVYGLFLAINAVDEDLTPEAKTILAIPQIKDDPDNGYLALVGLNAPPGEDIVTYGKQWVETYNIASDKAALEKANARFDNDKPPFAGDEKLLCNPTKTPCLPEARKNADLWRKLATFNELLLTRQRRVTGCGHFDECYFSPIEESPDPYLYKSSRLLELDMIALDAAEGHLTLALAALEARISFDHRALLGCRSLIPGMMATSWLRQDYALLAEIVATGSPALKAEKYRLVRMTEPLNIDLIRAVIRRLVEGDRRIAFNLVHNSWDAESLKRPTAKKTIIDLMNDITKALEGEHWWLSILQKPFFKPHASLNLAARNLTDFQVRLLDFTTENSDIWISRIQQEQKSKVEALIYSWRFLYNPTGKYALSEYQGYETYLAKLSNLIGVTRLARLQVEIATDESTKADIPAFIAANKALYDPYTGKPMGWDASKRHLYFDTYFQFPKEKPTRIKAGI